MKQIKKGISKHFWFFLVDLYNLSLIYKRCLEFMLEYCFAYSPWICRKLNLSKRRCYMRDNIQMVYYLSIDRLISTRAPSLFSPHQCLLLDVHRFLWTFGRSRRSSVWSRRQSDCWRLTLFMPTIRRRHWVYPKFRSRMCNSYSRPSRIATVQTLFRIPADPDDSVSTGWLNRLEAN